jgi:tetratricopeptide (TPR) repeat protein
MDETRRRCTALVMIGAGFLLLSPGLRAQRVKDAGLKPSAAGAGDAGLATSIEAARRTRDEAQLKVLSAQLEERAAQNPNDAQAQYDLALVRGYLVDAYEARKDKKAANATIDKAIEAAQRSIQLNDKSADAHSLLADLYGRKIGLGNGVFAGPKFGPKVKEENQRAMALDDKDPRAWASLGRQYLMAPKMFGGDVTKAIESLQKSLSLDTQQDDTYVWLAKAYEKQGDKAKAREAIQHALQLNPASPIAKHTATELAK